MAIRAVDAIIRASEGDQLPPAFATFVEKVVKSKEIAPLYGEDQSARRHDTHNNKTRNNTRLS
jgi:hypothetical protein